MAEEILGYVYHIQDPRNPDISCGYVGVTKATKGIAKRFNEHANHKKIDYDHYFVNITINSGHLKEIFHGTLAECYSYEHKLRPNKNMGWNLSIGGRGGDQNYKSYEEIKEIRSKNQTKRMQDAVIKSLLNKIITTI